MLIRRLRWPAVMVFLAVAITLTLTAGRALGLGFIMAESKEKLKLQYEVVVDDHGTGRVTIVFTLADEGRLAPLDRVQFHIPAKEKLPDGGRHADLDLTLDMEKAVDGKRVGRVHIARELAERAEIWLNTYTMDGKTDRSTRLHHVIPVAKYMKAAPAVPGEPTAAPTAATARN